MTREPAVIIGAIGTFANAVAIGVVYNQSWSAEGSVLILGGVNAFIGVLAALSTRQSVYSPESYDAKSDG